MVTVWVPAASAPVVTVRPEPFMAAAPLCVFPSTLTVIFAARTGYLPFSMVAVPEIVAFAPASTVTAVLFRCTEGQSLFVTA